MRFIHNEDHIAQTSTSDVGQWRDQDLLLIDHLVDLFELLVLLLELVLDDSEFALKCAKQLGDNGKHRELANAIRLVLSRNPDI